jgi:hypothetical protein
MGATVLILVLVLWVVPIVLTTKLGKQKGRDSAVLYGVALGWIGVLVVWALPADARSSPYRECPFCKERVRKDATVCPHCHRDVDAVAVPTGSWSERQIIRRIDE